MRPPRRVVLRNGYCGVCGVRSVDDRENLVVSKRKQIWEQEIPIPTTVPQVIREKVLQMEEKLASKPTYSDELITVRRGDHYKFRYEARQLDMCDKMLTDAGVPEWVSTADSCVPGNSTPCRLRWFLARRKDVSESEAEPKLQLEMRRLMETVKRYKGKS